MYTLGIDVHKDESQVAVLDADDEIHREVRVDNANLDALAQEYEGCEAAIEATGNYYTIYDTLDEYLDVVVADPARTEALGLVEAKNDRLDAKLREQLRSAGMIAQSYVPPKEIRERRALSGLRKFWRRSENPVRDEYLAPVYRFYIHQTLFTEGFNSCADHSVRGRKGLVEKRTQFKNEVHAVLDRQGISYDWDPFSQEGREVLASLPGER